MMGYLVLDILIRIRKTNGPGRSTGISSVMSGDDIHLSGKNSERFVDLEYKLHGKRKNTSTSILHSPKRYPLKRTKILSIYMQTV